MRSDVVVKADVCFKNMLDEVRCARLTMRKEKNPLSYRRLTLAISRVPKLQQILIDSEFQEEKLWRRRPK